MDTNERRFFYLPSLHRNLSPMKGGKYIDLWLLFYSLGLTKRVVAFRIAVI
jgi:hypothetical protein